MLFAVIWCSEYELLQQSSAKPLLLKGQGRRYNSIYFKWTIH